MEFARELIGWYLKNGRELPWRMTKDPYKIWVSEIILQQTRVVQGMDYYLRFIERFPDVVALADASEDEVLKLWQGLGYYSRARNMREAAKRVAEKLGGVFPTEYSDSEGEGDDDKYRPDEIVEQGNHYSRKDGGAGGFDFNTGHDVSSHDGCEGHDDDLCQKTPRAGISIAGNSDNLLFHFILYRGSVLLIVVELENIS